MNRPLLERALAALELINHRGNTDDELLQVGTVMTEIREELDKPPLIDCGCAILKNGDCYQVYAVKMGPRSDD